MPKNPCLLIAAAYLAPSVLAMLTVKRYGAGMWGAAPRPGRGMMPLHPALYFNKSRNATLTAFLLFLYSLTPLSWLCTGYRMGME